MHRRFLSNLWQGVRLACLRRPQPVPGVGQLLLLLALGWGCAFIADWRQAPDAVRIAPWGWAAEAARGYVWLFIVAVISVAECGHLPFLPLAVALAAADLTIWAVWLAVVSGWPPLAPASFGVVQPHLWQAAFIWQVAILLPAIKAVSGRLALRHLAYVVLYAGALYANHQWLPDYPLLEDAPIPEAAVLDVESIYYRQPDLLGKALRQVAAGVAGRRELFIVTFAGFGEEDVFRREAVQVAQILGRRFRAETRQLQLINNRATLATHPLASRSNLAVALRAISRKMQPDEDLLFLFMTSHGSEQGEFAIELGELGLNGLNPSELRATLDEAGIRWRVIVVSACYSGQFIRALENPQTLLITAAARDRASFGCAHDNAWTYFGEAYFRHALLKTRSFIGAFRYAEALIRRRERREGKEPSEPQIRLGAEIAPVLAAFEDQFLSRERD